jgi:hypothetical protein
MNAIRKTLSFLTGASGRWAERESAEDRQDREALESARAELRAGGLETVPLEQAKRELGD